MPLTITDTLQDLSGNPVVGAQVVIRPLTSPLFVNSGGGFIERVAGQYLATTDASGIWTTPTALPFPSVSDPANVKWSVILPDGTTWAGTVPEGVAGPVTIKTLKDTYGWGLVAGTAALPVTAVQGPAGVAGPNPPYGLHSARPAAGTQVDKALYYETDTTTLFQIQSGAWVAIAGLGGTGTVTSVALTVPTAEFSVTGSPITGAGTLAITKATQAANLVYSGPTSGGSAAPTFRALVAADFGSHVVPDTALSTNVPLLNVADVFTSTVTATAHVASGLTGATAASAYVGGTASGAPTSGTFAIGNYVIDQTGKMWICTAAGTPGTWTQVGGGGGGLAWNTIVTNAGAVGNIGLILRGAASQSGAILKGQNSTPADLFAFDAHGRLSITPNTTGTQGLLVNMPSGETANIIEGQANGGRVFSVDPTGRTYITNLQMAGGGTINALYITDFSGAGTGPYLTFTASGTPLTLNARGSAAASLFEVIGMAAQSGDLQRWRDSTPTTMAFVRSDGVIVGQGGGSADNRGGIATLTKAGAPVDGDWTTAPPVGTIVVDTTNSKIYVRTAAATWKGVGIA